MTPTPKSIFLSLAHLPEPERSQRVAAACGDDEALRREVDELLAYSAQSGDVLESLGMDWGDGDSIATPGGVLGPFRIKEQLGQGATSIVYRASRTDGTGAPLALKIFRGLGFGRDSSRRFQSEASVLERLEHPLIAELLDAGVFEIDGRQVPYVATELVEGASLTEWAHNERPETSAVLRVLADVADVLAYAHGQGVVHRDMKPANILVDAEGRPHVLDFGMARLVDPNLAGESLLTRVGQIVGTLAYMSPEQAQAGPDPVDGRADLYALGVIGYELLARRLPIAIPSDSLHRAVVAILIAEPTALGRVRPELAGDVEALLARLIAKRPEDRYQSAETVAADLRRLARGERLRLKPVRSAERGRRMRQGALVLIAALAVALAAWQLTRPKPLSAESRRTLNQAMGTLARCTERIQAPIKNRQDLRAAIADLESTRDALSGLPAGVPLTQITYYLYWRLGEAHYFLGELDDDVAEYRNAARAWGDGWTSGFRRDEHLPISPTAIQYREVAQFAEYTLPGGMALVELALARLERPLFHARAAARSTERVPGGIGARSYLAECPPMDPALLQRDRCMAWNNAAEAQLLVGRLTADTTSIDTSLVRTARAILGWPTPEIQGPLASMHFNRGEAWLERARLTGRAPERDSAAASLRRALQLRPLETSSRSHLGTRVELGNWALLQAEAAPTRAAREAILGAAVADIERARALVPLDHGTPRAAEYQLVLAELAVARAAAGRRAELATADTLLTQAAAVLTPDRFLLRNAEVQRVRALWHATRARLGLGHDERAAATECLRRALEATDETQDPAGHRRLESLLADIQARR